MAWGRSFQRAVLAVALAMLCAMAAPVAAQERGQLFVTQEQGFGRVVLSFPDRLDLPAYTLKMENSVLVVAFSAPVTMSVPDVSSTLGDYIGIARLDPDGMGLRFGLRTALNVNHIEAGEKLFIDLLPANWQGMPPGLPPEVVAELTQRAIDAAKLAEQQRKADLANVLSPIALLRVGRNPTFVRVQFDWNVDTEAEFTLDGETGHLDFDWPVPVDLYQLQADLPAELVSVENIVSPDGSRIAFRVAPGVTPRFYQASGREFILDIDLASTPEVPSVEARALTEAKEHAEAEAAAALAAELSAASPEVHSGEPASRITPYVTAAGPTVRIVLPFENDTAAAVFKRGNTVWMLFDTMVGIDPPTDSAALDSVATGFSVTPAGETQVVRMDLSADRLATLGSEGRAWVLSLGDALLLPTEPVALNRRRDVEGMFEVTADLDRPAAVHEFRDPVAGDILQVVTAFPPARGVVRPLEFVDFAALPSVHGLVVKPLHDGIDVAIDAKLAIITSPGGLVVSALDHPRANGLGETGMPRDDFVDLNAAVLTDPLVLTEQQQELMDRAAISEGAERDQVRLELAKLYVANQFGFESIGVLRVLESELKSESLKEKVRLTEAIANVVSHRPEDALAILNSPAFADGTDALMWRAIAKADAFDFMGARTDAAASETIVDGYPAWVRSRFYLAAIRAAIETNDPALAARYIDTVDFARFGAEEANLYLLLTGRLAELEGRTQEAVDTYGQIIAADMRPTRAEAVYRTLLLLDRTGEIDLAKATATLSAEVLLWRGGSLEADMQKLLAELYFRNHDYRLGFETVKQVAQYYSDSPQITALVEQAQAVFGELYLDGEADAMSPVDALSLYYDFRQLTPPGARGDEMIRNLARRLVKVDLLAQAAELLQYQVENRLEGVAKAQIATDLAIIEIADRQPEAALRVLNETRNPDLSPSLERQRRIIEARALIDAGRYDLALDLTSRLTGRDADLLRIDAHWESKRYREAAELLEVMYSGEGADLLNQPARMNVIKAAVGFVLADDKLGLSRLRSKFSAQMAQSAEWPMFDFVTGTVEAQSVEFKQVAREVSGLDSLNAFLEAYGALYGGTEGLAPDSATPEGEQI